MGQRNGSPGACTASQKQLCNKFAKLFEKNSELCGLKGDLVSKKAWAYVASIMRDTISAGQPYIDEMIQERDRQISARLDTSKQCEV